MRLHGFFRSTASWRVRIVLGIKGIAFDQSSYNLRNGDQRSDAYLAVNPQGLVPTLELDDGTMITQSLAICEYLDDIHPQPALLPTDPRDRAKVRAMAQSIACDVHPVQNLRILRRLQDSGLDADAAQLWARSIITEGLGAYEQQIEPSAGPFSWGKQTTLADVCLIPQLGNARRFGVALESYPKILAVEAACQALPAFRAAAPQEQPDAE